MPWDAEDADRHIKGLTDKQKQAWAAIANSVRKTCLAAGGSEKTCDARAIRIANQMAKRAHQADTVERVMRLNAEPRQLHEILGEMREDTIRHDEATGVLTAEVIISREAVLPYETPEGIVYEYIPAEELRSETFLKSAHGKPVTDGHPAEEIVTMDTLSEYAKGALHGPFQAVEVNGSVAVVGNETIWDPDLIREIIAGRKRQVSVGRWAVLRDEVGEFGGKKYTRRQTTLVVNHLAHTDRGRQGNTCRILLDEAKIDDVEKELDGLYDIPAENIVGGLKDLIARHGHSPSALARIGSYIEGLKGVLAKAVQVAKDATTVAVLHTALDGLNAEWPDLVADTAEPMECSAPSRAGQEKRGDKMPIPGIKIGTTELQVPEQMLSALDKAGRANFEQGWKALTDAVTKITGELESTKAALANKTSALDEAQAKIKAATVSTNEPGNINTSSANKAPALDDTQAKAKTATAITGELENAKALLTNKVSTLDEAQAKIKEANDKYHALLDEFNALKEKVEKGFAVGTVTDAVTQEVEERSVLLDAIRLVNPDYVHAGVSTGRMKRDLLALYHEDMREDAIKKDAKGEYVRSDAYVQARVDLILDALRNKRGASLGAALLKPMAKKDTAIDAKRKARLEMYGKGGERR